MLDRFRSVFLIEFGPDGARLARGMAPAGFVAACTDVGRLHRVATGTVECLGQGRHARLRFSKNFPERARQPILNVWTPPTGPGTRSGRRARG